MIVLLIARLYLFECWNLVIVLVVSCYVLYFVLICSCLFNVFYGCLLVNCLLRANLLLMF